MRVRYQGQEAKDMSTETAEWSEGFINPWENLTVGREGGETQAEGNKLISTQFSPLPGLPVIMGIMDVMDWMLCPLQILMLKL